jgi:hypothetical protein
MKTYKYETHLHTSEASACGSSKAADYISVYKRIGYDGIFVTDHFFGGNTCVSFELDWSARIQQYCSGYEAALEEAQKQNEIDGGNFKVFFGIEQTFDGDDYLIYGLNKEWLLAHPEIESMNHGQLFEAVSQAGGLMIQAHPFRLRGYIQAIHLHPREVHGIEVYNGGNTPDQNELALAYAKAYDFPMTSGSDIHNITFALENKIEGKMNLGGMEFDEPLNKIEDYIRLIKEKKGRILR